MHQRALRHGSMIARGALAAMALALSLGAAAKPATRDPHEAFFTQTFGDLPEELATARAAGKRGLLLFFEQEGCPYCERMMKTVLNQVEVQDWYNARFVSIEVDINGDIPLTDFDGVTLPSKVFAEHRRVFTTPTLSFIDLQGTEVHRRASMVATPEEFLRLGRYVADQHYTDTSWADFEAAATSANAHATELRKVADFREEGRAARDEQQVILLAVTRQGCPYCAALRRDVLLPMARHPEITPRLRIREMVMDPSSRVTNFDGAATTTARLAKRWGVKVAPTVLLLDGSGRLLADPVVGYNSADTYGFLLDPAVEQALGTRPGEPPQRED